MNTQVPCCESRSAWRARWCALAAVAAALFASAGRAQTVNIYHVPWDPADATAKIQKAIDEAVSPSKIILDYHPTPWYTSEPIIVSQSNMQIWFANGVEVKAAEGGHRDWNAAMFVITGDNVKMNGYYNGLDAASGRTLIEMRRDDYLDPSYPGKPNEPTKKEFRHCISVRGGRNAIIQGFRLRRAGGDGLAINNATGDLPGNAIPGSPPYNVTVKDVICDDNYRQGMSVFSVDTLTVTNSTFQGSNGTAPKSGVDIEPTLPTDVLKAVKFVSCTFQNNAGDNLTIDLRALKGTNLSPVDIRVESSLVQGGATNGIAFRTLRAVDEPEGAGPTGTIVVKNTLVSQPTLSGLLFSHWAADRVKVTLANVDLYRCGASKPPVLFTQTDGFIPVHGEVSFQYGCEIDDMGVVDRTHPMVYAGEFVRDEGLKDITGAITVLRPATSDGSLITLGSNTTNCTLSVTEAP